VIPPGAAREPPPATPPPATPPAAERPPWRLSLAVGVVLVAIVATGLFLLARSQLEAHKRTVEGVAELKARQVEVWLGERLGTAEFIAAGRPLGRLYEAWRDGEAEGGGAFLARLGSWGESNGFGQVTLLSADGGLLWSTGQARHGIGAARLAELWPDGPVRGEVRFAGTAHDEAGGLHLHVAAALNVRPGVAVPVVIGHVSPAELLPPSLRAWPTPRATGRVLLLRPDGGRVDALQEPAPGSPGAPAAWSRELDQAGAVARTVLDADGDTVASRLSPDHRGVWALGAGRRVAGTDWYLLAQVDRAELAAATLPLIGSAWTAALLLLGAGIAALRLVRQRQRLALADARRVSDERRLRTLGLLRAVTDSSTDAITAKDLDGRYLLFNPAAEAGTGVPAERALGRTDEALFPAAWAEHIAGEDREVLAARTPRTFERPFDGGGANVGRVVRATKAPLRDPEGGVFGLIAVSRDVHDEVAAAEQLRKLSSAVEQSPESVVITDRDARIEYVNDAFVAQTGYAREEVQGRNPGLLNSGKTPAATYRDMWRTLEAGRTWRGEFHNRRKDGSEFDELAIVSPLKDPDGRVTHYLAVKEDVTERKRLEGELATYRHHLEELVAERTAELAEARARAEAANQAKSTFLTHMSHEIRTPLNAIVGLAHLMGRADPPPEQRDRLAKIDTAARHLLAIVNDILDLARIEAGKLHLERTDLDVADVVASVADIVTEEARTKRVAVRTDVAASPRRLRGDPVRLRQALLNLAGNAVKFTERGAVVLRAHPVDRAEDRVRMRFEVEDSGVGMTAEQVVRAFEAFEQGDPSTTRHHGGTGLGLAITHRLIDAMGGTIDVDSAPGRGTRITLEVELERPAQAAPAPSPPAVGDASEALSGARVLLAEDHEINREVACELLRAAGVAVDAAGDGRAAVERAEHDRYDLVLLDVRMPGVDGLQATRMLRALPGYGEVPILAMTANVSDEERDAFRAAGMDGVVPKPIDPDELYAALARHLAGRGGTVAPPVARPDGAALADEPLPPLRGVDARRGLEALRGDAPGYLRLLRRFSAAHRDDAERLRAELERGRTAAARDRAHALKGVAGTLGADAVARTAAKLDALLDGAPEDGASAARDGEAQALVGELAAALSEIEAGLVAVGPDVDGEGETAAAAPREPDARGPTSADLDGLERLLEGDDFDAVAEVERQRERLDAALGAEAADAVVDAAVRLDLRAALARLRKARRTADASASDRTPASRDRLLP
jgi:PAS domain S-box-containing protein